MAAQTLFDKIWESHVVRAEPDGTTLLYIDRQLVHEVTSPQAFEGLKLSGRRPRRPVATLAVPDHNVPTTDRTIGIADPLSAKQIQTLEENCRDFDITLFDMNDIRQGVVHVIGPEQGFTLPGTTIVCGDSHTSTHGAFGALAFGIGSSEVAHVFATQCLLQRKPKTLAVEVGGRLQRGVHAKDLALAILARLGNGGGSGHVIEYRGETIRGLSMDERMTLCNLTVEGGARAGMVAPDETTFEDLRGKPFAPVGIAWNQAVSRWRDLVTDPGATFDRVLRLDASQVEPMITWGTTPSQAIPIRGSVPELDDESDPSRDRALRYMGLRAGEPLLDHHVDVVFLGSCTNSRLSDLRVAATVLAGRRIAECVRMLVVPGSEEVKRRAEEEGLAEIFLAAGAEWREPGCSMCIAMNGDQLPPGQFAVSTSNRNFEGRQGPGGRTFLASPLTAAACALTGAITDPREIQA